MGNSSKAAKGAGLVGSTDETTKDTAPPTSGSQPSGDQPKPNENASGADAGAGTASASTAGADAVALPAKVDLTVSYAGTKVLLAAPMTRGEYNAYRGWTLPEGEDPADAGYLVEYTDGGKPNDDRHEGYISWSPADVFEKAYRPNGSHVERMEIELDELSARGEALAAFIMTNPTFATLPERDQALMREQMEAMRAYGRTLDKRLRRAQDPEAAAADDKRENADEFAERAGAQQKRARKGDATKDYLRAVAGSCRFADLPEGVPLQLRFADGESFLPDALPIEVLRGELVAGGSKERPRATYAKPVEFTPEGSRVEITEAWLIAGDGKKSVRCKLAGKLPVGGGRVARIPGGNLIF